MTRMVQLKTNLVMKCVMSSESAHHLSGLPGPVEQPVEKSTVWSCAALSVQQTQRVRFSEGPTQPVSSGKWLTPASVTKIRCEKSNLSGLKRNLKLKI